jgi:hypothetical protein
MMLTIGCLVSAEIIASWLMGRVDIEADDKSENYALGKHAMFKVRSMRYYNDTYVSYKKC